MTARLSIEDAAPDSPFGIDRIETIIRAVLAIVSEARSLEVSVVDDAEMRRINRAQLG